MAEWEAAMGREGGREGGRDSVSLPKGVCAVRTCKRVSGLPPRASVLLAKRAGPMRGEGGDGGEGLTCVWWLGLVVEGWGRQTLAARTEREGGASVEVAPARRAAAERRGGARRGGVMGEEREWGP